MDSNTTNSGMDEKTMGIVTYLTLIGFIVVLVIRKQKTEYTSFHLRQMAGLIALQLGISIISSVLGGISSFLGTVGSLFYIVTFVLWLIAFMGALNQEKKLVPVLGEQFQEWFKNLF